MWDGTLEVSSIEAVSGPTRVWRACVEANAFWQQLLLIDDKPSACTPEVVPGGAAASVAADKRSFNITYDMCIGVWL